MSRPPPPLILYERMVKTFYYFNFFFYLKQKKLMAEFSLHVTTFCTAVLIHFIYPGALFNVINKYGNALSVIKCHNIVLQKKTPIKNVLVTFGNLSTRSKNYYN